MHNAASQEDKICSTCKTDKQILQKGYVLKLVSFFLEPVVYVWYISQFQLHYTMLVSGCILLDHTSCLSGTPLQLHRAVTRVHHFPVPFIHLGLFALHQFMDNIGMKYSINVQKHCTMFQRCHNGALQHASLLVVSTSGHQKQCTRHHFPWQRRVWRPGHMTPFTYAATSDIPFSSFWAYFTFWWSPATAMAWPGSPAPILCLTTTPQYARH